MNKEFYDEAVAIKSNHTEAQNANRQANIRQEQPDQV